MAGRDDRCWNIMMRDGTQPHFRPFYGAGTFEREARRDYEDLLTDAHFGSMELQLVRDYSYHFEYVMVASSAPHAAPRRQRRRVIDGWIGVLNNATTS